MTVQWIKLHESNTPVHLYKDHEDRTERHMWFYRGRTALFKEELQKGNTSLILFNVRVSDEGKYKCLVDDKNWHDDITLEVITEVVGTHPMISMEGFDNSGRVRLLCETSGWHPEASDVLWLDSEGEILPAQDTQTNRDIEGFSVKQRVIVPDSDTNRFFCRVMMRDHMKETDIFITSDVFQTWNITFICISVFTVIFVTAIISLIGLLCRQKVYHQESEKKRIQEEFENRRRLYAEDVTLDPDTAHPELIVSDDGKQVTHGKTQQCLPDNPERFDYCICVLGKEGFSSGRFYYEVEVRGKTDWDLGVVRESINRKGEITLSPENGYWTIWLRNGNEYKACEHFLVHLSLRQKPQKLGVFVDYEEGLVSFYDVEARSLIYSFTGQSFTEKLYPYLSPDLKKEGKNTAPLIIHPLSSSYLV